MHLLRNGLCRTANLCKAGLIVGALRVACNGLPTAARFRTAEENPGCNSGCSEGLDCLWYFYRCPRWSTIFVHSGPALANEFLLPLFSMTPFSPPCICEEIAEEVTSISEEELMYGRFKIMTAPCPAPSICEETAKEVTFYFEGTHVWLNQDDDCPMSGVRPNLSFDVLDLQCSSAPAHSSRENALPCFLPAVPLQE